MTKDSTQSDEAVGRIKALAEDLERWAKDADARDEPGKATAYRRAATAVRDRLLSSDDQRPETTPLERIDECPSVGRPLARLQLEEGPRDVKIFAVVDVDDLQDEEIRDLALAADLKRLARYEVVGMARMGMLGEDAAGNVYDLRWRFDKLLREPVDIEVLVR